MWFRNHKISKLQYKLVCCLWAVSSAGFHRRTRCFSTRNNNKVIMVYGLLSIGRMQVLVDSNRLNFIRNCLEIEFDGQSHNEIRKKSFTIRLCDESTCAMTTRPYSKCHSLSIWLISIAQFGNLQFLSIQTTTNEKARIEQWKNCHFRFVFRLHLRFLAFIRELQIVEHFAVDF